MKNILLLVVIMSFALVFCSAASANTVYVNGTNGNDSNDGSSWQYAKQTIGNATGTLDPNGTIYIANGNYTGTKNQNITITKNMTIIGQNQNTTIINAENITRIFTINNGITITLKNLTLQNGNSNNGSAIYNEGTLIISDSTFTGNNATEYYGGTIYNTGTLTVSDSTFKHNNANVGGAITNWGSGNTTITSSSLYNNTAISGSGGAIFNYGGSAAMTITDSTLYNNTASSSGGAIFNNGANMAITDSTLYNNTALHGGAISNQGGIITIINSTLYNNTAYKNAPEGGSYFSYGGAIYNIHASIVTITNCTLYNNTATTNGGAIYYDGSVNITITSSSLYNNTANNGGAIYNKGTGSLTVNYCRIIGNSLMDIYFSGASVDLEDNWWGSNDDPSDRVSGATVSNWLVLSTNIPSIMEPGKAYNVTVDLLHDQNNNPVSGAVPDGINVTFTIDLPSLGSFNPSSNVFVDGQATSEFSANTIGITNLTATVDNQTITKQIAIKILTQLQVGNVTGLTGDTANLTATLTDGNGTPIPNKTVTFKINNTTVGTATTDTNGTATYTYTIPTNTTPGQYVITADFPGDSNYYLSSGTGTLNVVSLTNLTVTNITSHPGSTTNLTATLTTTTGSPVPNKTITFKVNSTTVGTATTDNNGIATYTYNIPTNTTPGQYVITADFPGDGDYIASNGTGTLNVGLLNIYPGDDVQSIINEAISGYIIIFHDNNGNPYTYHVNLIIEAALNLTTQGQVTLNAANINSPVILLTSGANGTNITGFNITGAIYSTGIYVNSINNITLKNNTITGNERGVNLLNSNNNNINNNNITGNNYGVIVYGNSTLQNNTITGNSISGLSLIQSTHNNITGNTISGGSTGANLQDSDNNNLENNTITGNQNYGIYLDNSHNNTITMNNITGNQVGVSSTNNSTNNNITGNTISGGSIGVNLQESDNNNLENNTITGNQNYGIYLDNSHNNTITMNNITGNKYGVVVDGTSNSTILRFNNFDKNTSYGLVNTGSGTVSAIFNWWNTNTQTNVSKQVVNTGEGEITYDPWIVLTITANPTQILINGNSTITADLLHDSNGGYRNPANGVVPYTGTATFTTTLGSIQNTSFSNGLATSTLKAGSTLGTANINITINGITTNTNLTIYTPLKVTSTNPTNNAVNIPINKKITITFNENIKAGTNWVELKNSKGTAIPFTTSISGKILTINPKSNLAESLYTLTIHTGAVTDLAGNPIAYTTSKFITGTPPTVTSVNPANNKVINVANKALVITFSENIKAGSAFTSIKVTNPDGVSVKPLYKVINGKTLTLTRNGYYINGLTYTITLPTNSITDTAGNTITAYTSKFTVDFAKPTVTSVNPANNKVINVANKALVITFSENIKAGSAFTSIKVTNPDGVKVKPLYKVINGKTLTLTRNGYYINGLTYTITLPTNSITDTAGNTITAFTSKFKIDTTRPKITSVNPANTATKVARNKNIKITFNENIKTSNNPRIELKTNNGTPVKTGKSINGKTLTITHTKLKANTKYKLTIHTGAITDTAGNPLAAKTITFTTGNT